MKTVSQKAETSKAGDLNAGKGVDLADGWIPDADGEAGTFARDLDLGGSYILRTASGVYEVELLDTVSLARTALYVRPGRDTAVDLPPGRYRAWLRALTEATGSLELARMGPGEKLALYAGKAVVLLADPSRMIERLKAAGAKRAPGPRAMVAAGDPGQVTFRQRPPRPALKPAPAADGGVSIVIPTKERVDLLRACIDSLDLIRDRVLDIVIIDNGATGAEMVAYLASLAARPNVRVARHDIPFNFSRLCNIGAGLARQPLLLFLNDDIEALDGDWLSAMTGFAARPDTGVVGARLLYPSGTLQHAGIASNLLPGPGHPWRGAPREVWEVHPLLATAGEVDAVTGACLMIGAGLFAELGGFDEAEFAITHNDVDLCLRTREKGLKVVYAPEATLLHKESQTRKPDQAAGEAARHARETAAFYRRHEGAARRSCFYPLSLRRDTDAALSV